MPHGSQRGPAFVTHPKNAGPRGKDHPVASPIHPEKDTAQGRCWIMPSSNPPKPLHGKPVLHDGAVIKK